MASVSPENNPIGYLRSAEAIRARCKEVYDLGVAGKLDHFIVRPERLDWLAGMVKGETLTNYPALDVPYHSRWRHFNAGGVDRVSGIHDLLAKLSPADRCRAKIELAIVSVLLDAGAGATWGYQDVDTGVRHQRSEGLAVASVYAFWNGVFGEPLTVSSTKLKALSVEELGQAFQVRPENALVGLEGRCAMLNTLGQVIEGQSQYFKGRPGRLGGMLEPIVALGDGSSVEASALLSFILEALADIWPGRIILEGKNLGDVWPHSKVGGAGKTKGLVPFHKLSQWLTYSLLEPLEEFGIAVKNLDSLTGLAEYRNGGLFIDGGALLLKDPSAASVIHAPGSELIVEWRALTVILLDHVAQRMRTAMGKTAAELPLAKVLQGGTWTMGRKLASGGRSDGSPPLRIQSDGTVF